MMCELLKYAIIKIVSTPFFHVKMSLLSKKARIVDDVAQKVQLDLSSDESESGDRLQELLQTAKEEQEELEENEQPNAAQQPETVQYDPRTDSCEQPEQRK